MNGLLTLERKPRGRHSQRKKKDMMKKQWFQESLFTLTFIIKSWSHMAHAKCSEP